MKKCANILLLMVLTVFSLAAKDDPRLAYIAKYSGIAVSEMKRTGVPASITLAQGLLESNSGQSMLAVDGNNHFGVKCHGDWGGRKIYKDAEKVHDCFRAYPNAEASFRDHSDFLRYRDRYKSLFSLKQTDYKGWAHGLKEAGYATDPAYPQKLIKLIEEYELYKYDSHVRVEAPQPLVVETPIIIEKAAEVLQDTVLYREKHSFSMARNIYSQNGVPFVYAKAGDTYESLAGKYNLFPKEILKYNDLNKSEKLKEGDMVYLKAKKNMGARGVDKYVLGDDEHITMRDVAQRFGVKLLALQKLNPFDVDAVLEPGDTVILRPAR